MTHFAYSSKLTTSPFSENHLVLFLPQMPSSSGQPGQGKKIGHRGVDASGETTYKKVLKTVLGGALMYF